MHEIDVNPCRNLNSAFCRNLGYSSTTAWSVFQDIWSYLWDCCVSSMYLFLSLLATISFLTASQNSSWIERYWRKRALLPWLLCFCNSSSSAGHSSSSASRQSTVSSMWKSSSWLFWTREHQHVDMFFQALEILSIGWVRADGFGSIFAPFCMIFAWFSPFLPNLHMVKVCKFT